MGAWFTKNSKRVEIVRGRWGRKIKLESFLVMIKGWVREQAFFEDYIHNEPKTFGHVFKFEGRIVMDEIYFLHV